MKTNLWRFCRISWKKLGKKEFLIKNNITAKAFKDLERECQKEDKQRLATNKAAKSTGMYLYLSSTPYQGRYKDERLVIDDYYKTTIKTRVGGQLTKYTAR